MLYLLREFSTPPLSMWPTELYMKDQVQSIAYQKVKLKMAEFEGILFGSFSPPKMRSQIFFVAGLKSWQLSTFYFLLYFHFIFSLFLFS